PRSIAGARCETGARLAGLPPPHSCARCTRIGQRHLRLRLLLPRSSFAAIQGASARRLRSRFEPAVDTHQWAIPSYDALRDDLARRCRPAEDRIADVGLGSVKTRDQALVVSVAERRKQV